MREHKPVIAITMGDVCGIGPEIILKAWTSGEIFEQCTPVVVGDAKILERAKGYVGSNLEIVPVKSLDTIPDGSDAVPCLDLDLLPEDLPLGTVRAEAGMAAFRFLEKAVSLALDGQVTAICTAPLNKAALKAAGLSYPGHTEILASLTGTTDYAMMLSAPQLKVSHVTTHKGLIEAIASITWQRVLTVIRLTHTALRLFGIAEPRIAVASINPHAGEEGLFGSGEEERKIVPAVELARADGLAVQGPIPADTVFVRAIRGEFDAVVAMYHDQGHIPVKVLGFDTGVNITLGLPFVRTSVDHGTAFDLAGMGKASAESLIEALRQAVLMSTASLS